MTPMESYVKDQKFLLESVLHELGEALKDLDPKVVGIKMQESRSHVRYLAQSLNSKFNHKALKSVLETILDHIKQVRGNTNPRTMDLRLRRLIGEVKYLAKILNKYYNSLLQLETDLFFLRDDQKYKHKDGLFS